MSTSDNSDDMKAKFREALAKKKSGGSKKGEAAGEKSKIRDVDSHGNTPKMFRRKSGSAQSKIEKKTHLIPYALSIS